MERPVKSLAVFLLPVLQLRVFSYAQLTSRWAIKMKSSRTKADFNRNRRIHNTHATPVLFARINNSPHAG
jgi:hypothetical protein